MAVACEGQAIEQTHGTTGSQQLLPDPFTELANGSDIGTQLASLIVTAAREQKTSAHESRKAAEAAQREADDKQLDDMKEEADDKLMAGLVTAGTEMASGAMTMGSACSSDTAQASWQGIGKMTEATGKAHATLLTHDADMAAKDVKQDEQISGREKRAVDDARDLDKDAKEMLDRALGYYKEYLTAKADTQRATLLKA